MEAWVATIANQRRLDVHEDVRQAGLRQIREGRIDNGCGACQETQKQDATRLVFHGFHNFALP